MKNKEKYDLRKLYFMWRFDSYHDRFEISILLEEKYITDITGGTYSPIPVIMEWLESECEEND